MARTIRKNTDPSIVGKRGNFLAVDVPQSLWKECRVAVLPIPFEKTVSYGSGTAGGPSAILGASAFVELFDEETGRDVSAELGIATLASLKFGRKPAAASLDLIENAAASVLDAGKRLVSLGGEHTISAPLVRAHLRRWPRLSILQIDAHSDLRDSYGGTPLSHACVMARICESVDPRRIVQVGIRAQCAEEAAFILERGITTVYAHEIRGSGNGAAAGHAGLPGRDGWIDRAVRALSDDVYVTFDVDGLDPSIMPSTGTPEPEGLSWPEAMTLLKETGRRKNVVGFDIVELSPIRGIHHADYTAAKLVSKMINYCFTTTRN